MSEVTHLGTGKARAAFLSSWYPVRPGSGTVGSHPPPQETPGFSILLQGHAAPRPHPCAPLGRRMFCRARHGTSLGAQPHARSILGTARGALRTAMWLPPEGARLQPRALRSREVSGSPRGPEGPAGEGTHPSSGPSHNGAWALYHTTVRQSQNNKAKPSPGAQLLKMLSSGYVPLTLSCQTATI